MNQAGSEKSWKRRKTEERKNNLKAKCWIKKWRNEIEKDKQREKKLLKTMKSRQYKYAYTSEAGDCSSMDSVLFQTGALASTMGCEAILHAVRNLGGGMSASWTGSISCPNHQNNGTEWERRSNGKPGQSSSGRKLNLGLCEKVRKGVKSV